MPEESITQSEDALEDVTDDEEERVDEILTDQVIEEIDGHGAAEPVTTPTEPHGASENDVDGTGQWDGVHEVADDPNEEDETDGDNPLATLPPQEQLNLPDDDDRLGPLKARIGEFGDREIRTFKLDVSPELRASGAGADQFTVKGHAAVFNVESLDLGYFTERIHPAAFDRVLSETPDVFLNWDHDMRYVFARTANSSLELTTDSVGLAYWARVAPVSYASDLYVLLDGGYIDQASFCFTVASDEWRIFTDEEGNETYERTILEIGDLFDVCITALGAYPQTDSGLARSYVRSYARSRDDAIRGALADRAPHVEPPAVGEAIATHPDLRAIKLRAARLRARARAEALGV